MYFEWSMEQIPLRIKYLEETSGCKLDMTRQSLVSLRRWFLDSAEVENTPLKRMDELKRLIKKSPFAKEIIRENETQFSLKTEYIMRDIGMYAGQYFVETSDKLHWDYFTGRDDYIANMPVISGFADTGFDPPFPMQFEPNNMIGVIASNIFDHTQKETDLFDLCNLWLESYTERGE